MLHSFTSYFLANLDLLSINGCIRNKSIGVIMTFLFNRTLKRLVYLLSSIKYRIRTVPLELLERLLLFIEQCFVV